MSRPRFVSLAAHQLRLVAGLDGGALPWNSSDFTEPSLGASSLTLAVSTQLQLERHRRAFIERIRPAISDRNAALLIAIFVDNLDQQAVADLQTCTRQAVCQRLATLRSRYLEIDDWWRDRGDEI